MVSSHRSRFRRGVGELIAAVFVISVVALFLVFMAVSIPMLGRKPAPSILKYSAVLNEALKLTFAPNGSTIVWNYGSVPVRLSIALILNGSTLELVRASSATTFGSPTSPLCSASPGIDVLPGNAAVITCTGSARAIGFITARGSVVTLDPRLLSRVPKYTALRQYQLLQLSVLENIGNYIAPSAINTLNAVEIQNTVSYGYVPLGLDLLVNVEGPTYVDISLSAAWIFIGYAPGNSSEFNILITGVADPRNPAQIAVGSQIYTIGLNDVTRFRIKILGLSIGNSTILVDGQRITEPSIYACYVDSGSMCTLKLSGVAKRVEVYSGDRYSSLQTTIDPYVITGDFDGNGYPEVVIDTEDIGYGDSSEVNDRYEYWYYWWYYQYSLLETTTQPIRIVFWDFPIDNTKYAVAIVSLRFAFWDNSIEGVSENDNRVILKVELYDNQTQTAVYSVSLGYYELVRYRTVSPATWSYVTKNFVLYIPSPALVGNRTYYIAIEIEDPYSLSVVGGSYINDADMIIMLEYAGVILGARG